MVTIAVGYQASDIARSWKKKSAKWVSRAANFTPRSINPNGAECCANGEGSARDFTAERLAVSTRRAYKWHPVRGNPGNAVKSRRGQKCWRLIMNDNHPRKSREEGTRNGWMGVCRRMLQSRSTYNDCERMPQNQSCQIRRVVPK